MRLLPELPPRVTALTRRWRLLGRHLSMRCCWDKGNNWCRGRIRLEEVLWPWRIRESRVQWWMDIFDDVREVSVSKTVCSYQGAHNFVFVSLII
jgi:hypothetical protein